MFPERLSGLSGQRGYGRRRLATLWGISVQKFPTSKSKETQLEKLESIIQKKFGAKSIGLQNIIEQFKDSKAEKSPHEFLQLVLKELGRISKEIIVTNRELELILGQSEGYLNRILSHFSRGNKELYNPNFKLSLEELKDYIDIFKQQFGLEAEKMINIIKDYKKNNRDLPECRLFYNDLKEVATRRYFSKLDSPIKLYWLGFLSADGSIESERPRISLELGFKDKEQIVKFADALNLDHRRIEEKVRLFKYRGNEKLLKSVRIRFDCSEMKSDLENLEFLKLKTRENGLPVFIKTLVSQAKKEASKTNIHWSETYSGMMAFSWLLGFYDGDGTYLGKYQAGESARIYSTNKILLEEIKNTFEVENNVLTNHKFNEEVLLVAAHALDTYKTSVDIHLLTLGPIILSRMINSYEDSMTRKRPTTNNFLK